MHLNPYRAAHNPPGLLKNAAGTFYRWCPHAPRCSADCLLAPAPPLTGADTVVNHADQLLYLLIFSFLLDLPLELSDYNCFLQFSVFSWTADPTSPCEAPQSHVALAAALSPVFRSVLPGFLTPEN